MLLWRQGKLKHIMTFQFTLEVIILILFFIPFFCFYSASGVCKHVRAILWYIEREVRLGNIKPVLQKNKSGMYQLRKTFDYTKLQDFKKLILRNRFHQKSLAHLVHQMNRKLQISQLENSLKQTLTLWLRSPLADVI